MKKTLVIEHSYDGTKVPSFIQTDIYIQGDIYQYMCQSRFKLPLVRWSGPVHSFAILELNSKPLSLTHISPPICCSHSPLVGAPLSLLLLPSSHFCYCVMCQHTNHGIPVRMALARDQYRSSTWDLKQWIWVNYGAYYPSSMRRLLCI